MNKRLIPILLLTEDGLIKTKKFKGNNYIGDPINAVKLFNEMEVDEIIILDIEATKKKREPQFELIEEIASEAFMPLCYGGGISNLEQAKKLFSLGVEKLALNNCLLRNPQMVEEMSETFGTQAIVASLDFSKNLWGKHHLFNYQIKKNLKVDINRAAENINKMGIGELLLNCVDRDGMMNGVEISLLTEMRKIIGKPIIYCGGIGNLDHIKMAFDAGANAVGAGAFFVYKGKGEGVLINYPDRQVMNSLLTSR